MKKPTVFIVDDDPAIRDSLGYLLESVGLEVKTYVSGEAFLEAYNPFQQGCIVADMRMPGISGLQLQQKLNELPYPQPLIMITGHGDVPMTVRAMKAGALDFVEKPFNDQDLLDKVQEGLRLDEENTKLRLQHRAVNARLSNLTQRENQVLELVLRKASNKEIAKQLSISPKTVEFHRAKLMDKMHAESVLDLSDMIRKFSAISNQGTF